MPINNELVNYASPKYLKFKTRIDVDGVDEIIQFVQGRYEATPAIAERLDELLASSKNNLQQFFFKVDREAAEALVASHQKDAAIKGGATAENSNLLKQQTMGASAQALAEAAPNNPEALAKFTEDLAHGDLLVTEQANKQADIKIG